MTEHIDKKTKRQEPLVLASLMISLMATSLIFLIVILIQGKGSALLSTGISGSAGPAVHRISAAEPGKNIISSISAHGLFLECFFAFFANFKLLLVIV